MKIHAIAVTTLALMLAPLGAYAGDVEDLKAALAKSNQAYNDRNADAVCNGLHEKVVRYELGNLNAYHGKQAACAALRGFFSSLEQSNLSFHGTKVQVVGSTGMVWGQWQYIFKQRDDGVEVHNGRWIGTFVKSDGKWLQTTFSATEFAPSLGQ